MDPKAQETLIRNLYTDIFQNAELEKFNDYFSEDFLEDNNFDVLDHAVMIEHVKEIGQRPDKAKFDLEFVVNVPGQVVVRTIVTYADQIQGAPPLSLLLSYWGINDAGKINRCIEVEYSGDDESETDSDDDKS